jgi:hypothetical protein
MRTPGCRRITLDTHTPVFRTNYPDEEGEMKRIKNRLFSETQNDRSSVSLTISSCEDRGKWEEVGENGTPHLQLKSRRRLSSVKNLPGMARCHLETMRGTAQEASRYCEKDDPNPYLKEELRCYTDLLKMKNDAKTGSELHSTKETARRLPHRRTNRRRKSSYAR